MKENIFSSISLTIVCLPFFTGINTLMVLGFSRPAPNKGKSEIRTPNGKIYYSNIGQKFIDDQYFWSRPSAVDCNAAGAGGSNKGSSNPDYLPQVHARTDTFLVHNHGIAKSEIPSDLVTACGGSLDPHISVLAANIQIKHIVKRRNIALDNLK